MDGTVMTMMAQTPRTQVDWNYVGAVAGAGVMTGCDAKQEWLLPWWWTHYSSCNTLPVVFIDYGMSASVRNWCCERGRVVTVPFKGNIMHAKPLALLRSPFEKTLWVDADCEVCACVQPILDAVGAGVVGVCHDPFHPTVAKSMDRRYIPVSSGTMVFHRDDPTIRAWALAMLAHPEYRDDQVALNTLHMLDRFCVLPRRFQWLRLDETQTRLLEPAIIRHWTGPAGKAAVQAMMAREGLIAPAVKLAVIEDEPPSEALKEHK